MADLSGQDNEPSEHSALLDIAVAESSNYYFDEIDYRNHRQLYIGVHLPLHLRNDTNTRRGAARSKHGHGHRHRHRTGSRRRDRILEEGPPPDPHSNLPSEKVRFILGEGDFADHQIFGELEEYQCEEDGSGVWKETARWVKFEEDVEEVGDRWSKPHVATLSLYSVFELRSCILHGTMLLHMNAINTSQIFDLILDDLVNSGQLEQDLRAQMKEVFLQKHKHQNTTTKSHKKTSSKFHLGQGFSRKSSAPTLAPPDKNTIKEGSRSVPFNLSALQEEEEDSDSANSFRALPSAVDLVSQGREGDGKAEDEDTNNKEQTYDYTFMKKLPTGAEASIAMVGELEFLKKPINAFVRLETGQVFGDMTEVPIPTRFIFIMMGPPSTPGRYHEVGRAMATLMSDEIFHEVAYKAQCREDILAAIDEFLMQVTVLPPGEWDPNIRIEPPSTVPNQEKRLDRTANGGERKHDDLGEEHDPAGDREEALRRTGRWFGGLIADMKRYRKRLWPGDLRDVLSLQSIASVIFIYIACLTPIITFGGLMSTKTGHMMGAMEQMLGGAIGGILFALFSGQPLIILGATGPMLVFEEIVYTFCERVGLEYLSFRLWIGIWTMLFCLILVVTDASAMICYFTRFTEETFATLIAIIYIYEGFKKLFHILDDYPIHIGYIEHHECFCIKPETVMTNVSFPNGSFVLKEVENLTKLWVPIPDCVRAGGELRGDGCSENVFLLSVMLCFGTFVLAITLKNFHSSSYFPSKVRAKISDFAVLISIMVAVGLDYAIGVDTPKLMIPLSFQPTAAHKRSWIVPPLGNNPGWTIPAAAIPAILATILVFMDQQITALIVNRREHKLKKGAGYHLDLLVVAIIVGICSILGLPWVVAATVLSVSHVQSLFVESEVTAPGEKTKFLGVREQRVTGFIIFLLIGLSVLMTPILKHIPMPVLYGLFLYMGFSALKGLQFFERLKIVFMPVKHQPDLMYLRLIQITRVHLFTLIQVICLALLWVIKSTAAGLVFPIMVALLVPVRKGLEKVFTKQELEVLDDLMPETIKKKKLATSMADMIDGPVDQDEEDDGNPPQPPEKNGDTPANGSITVDIPINITDEMTKSSLWKSFVKDGAVKTKDKERKHSHSKHNKHRHKHGGHGGHGRHKRRESDKEDKDDDDQDNGLWLKKDRKHLDTDDDAPIQLRRLDTIDETPVVDPKEAVIDIPDITVSSSNDFDASDDKKEV
ncbi:sodium-driven chloride bicarbonate exchanger isoform X2 [Nematostella vectensis]|uniref:sodium-driven chloride bicarbonate exchanger isoform X2 n=1 Tax=Nematostella vectensis TaxID=45351 RepID=UPI002077458C|nr:sodium-driven chloride bicarbonate exchanger isoform X2 [Nematostella vectensis]